MKFPIDEYSSNERQCFISIEAYFNLWLFSPNFRTYTAINHGIVHTEDLPGHFESVVIENNDEAPTLPPPTEVEQPAAPMEPMEPKEE